MVVAACSISSSSLQIFRSRKNWLVGIDALHLKRMGRLEKRHTHANNYFVILRGSSYTLKKAVMPKRRSFYTAI